ncbi:hypothetical protein LINPERPRIM_LOCUS28191, partial [Linum perenne]
FRYFSLKIVETIIYNLRTLRFEKILSLTINHDRNFKISVLMNPLRVSNIPTFSNKILFALGLDPYGFSFGVHNSDFPGGHPFCSAQTRTRLTLEFLLCEGSAKLCTR